MHISEDKAKYPVHWPGCDPDGLRLIKPDRLAIEGIRAYANGEKEDKGEEKVNKDLFFHGKELPCGAKSRAIVIKGINRTILNKTHAMFVATEGLNPSRCVATIDPKSARNI